MNNTMDIDDVVLGARTPQELLKKFKPEIQEILYNFYDENLENLPDKTKLEMDSTLILELLLELSDIKSQKVILSRLGIISGNPMSCEEVANEFNITTERVKQIERKFLRPLAQQLHRKSIYKKLGEFTNKQ